MANATVDKWSVEYEFYKIHRWIESLYHIDQWSSIENFRKIENHLICYWDPSRLTVNGLLNNVNLDKSQ